MNKAPNTDKSLGINLAPDWQKQPYADIRHKAKVEELDRNIKAKKDKRIVKPKHKIDELVVLVNNYGNLGREYIAVKILDIRNSNRNYQPFIYYGVIESVSRKEMLDEIGHLIHFTEGGYYCFGSIPANVAVGSIKWIQAKAKDLQ